MLRHNGSNIVLELFSVASVSIADLRKPCSWWYSCEPWLGAAWLQSHGFQRVVCDFLKKILHALVENIFSELAPPLYTGSKVEVLEECSNVSVTPGNTHSVPKFQVILLLDKQQEKQYFLQLSPFWRVEWWKTSQSAVVDSWGSSACEAALALEIPPWSKSVHSDSLSWQLVADIFINKNKPSILFAFFFFNSFFGNSCREMRLSQLWSQQAWTRNRAPVLSGMWLWDSIFHFAVSFLSAKWRHLKLLHGNVMVSHKVTWV